MRGLFSTTLVSGSPAKDRSFYILPLPPTAFEPSKLASAIDNTLFRKKRTLLNTLFHRMEKLITLEPDNPATLKKFDDLKALYNQIAGTCHLSSQALLKAIQDWRQQHPEIKQLRKTYWFDSLLNFFGQRRHSATEKMFDTVEKMLGAADI